ncbi:class I SAM-dependent methyltransferase [Candidatus Berkelbacteria bacterium]|nr:class I SAM-dependent methyltransferase [Candidatus Berkelbacteria bacterium]
MLGKQLIRHLFGKLSTGQIQVVYWDGGKEHFGSQGQTAGTLTIHNEAVLATMAQEAELGFAEGYMSGAIDFDGRLHDLILLAIENGLTSPAQHPKLIRGLIRGLTKATTVREQLADVSHHYDLGNEFFQLFLDETMTYSCAYFKKPDDSLETAQRQKVDHTLRKLNLQKGEHLLDIGSGWGQMILQAAKEYGVTAHGITMSEEQRKATQERINIAKLNDQVTVELIDYRELAARQKKTGAVYDTIVSVGMFEHVGRPNLPVFLDAIKTILKPGGLMLLHFITQLMEGRGGSFTLKYIFPGGYIPSVRETVALLPDRNFRLLDVENLRLHYAMTLDRWADNFEDRLDEVRTMFADRERLGKRWGGAVEAEKFIRMWRLYLQGAAAGFRGGNLELHQFLFSNGANNNLPLTREAWYR